MALELTGIDNVEFYSSHYLDAVLEGDLKAVFARWRKQRDEDGKRPPYEALAGLAIGQRPPPGPVRSPLAGRRARRPEGRLST